MGDVVAIIAPGEMGAGLGRVLAGRGARVITTLAGRSATSIARAERAGIAAVESADRLVAEADFLLSIVPPGAALDLARHLAPALGRSARKPVYVDCNAIAPATAARIGAALADTGCDYVDAGIIGAPPSGSGPGPRLYVSGGAAPRVARLSEHGLDVRVLDGPAGAASALKMSYAGITKGLTAIGAAMMLSATRGDAATALQRELRESQPQLVAWLARQVPAMYPKAYRWVAEMEEIAAFAEPDAAAAAIYAGAARLYERLAREAGAPPPEGELAALTRFCRALGER